MNKNVIFCLIFVLMVVFFLFFNCSYYRFLTQEQWEGDNNNDGEPTMPIFSITDGIPVSISESAYEFIASENQICNKIGKVLITGVDFNYDNTFDKYDNSNDDSTIVSGKFLKILYNNKNISASIKDGGLGLTSIAKDLKEDKDKKLSPLSNQFYIDPVTGKFILPRPVYWSRCESLEGIQKGVIGTANVISYNTDLNSKVHKFNNGLGVKCDNPRNEGSHYFLIKPECENLENKGTISLWLSGDYKGEAWCFLDYIPYRFYYCFDDNSYICLEMKLKASIFCAPLPPDSFYKISYKLFNKETNSYAEGSTDFSIQNTTKHLYIVYDTNTGLNVYGNGIILLFYNGNFTASNTPSMKFYVNGLSSAGSTIVPEIFFDNIKIWNDKFDDPSFEYNNGNGNENALHLIYGAENAYRPSDDLFKIFYYYIKK